MNAGSDQDRLRQACEWLESGTWEQQAAAVEHLEYLASWTLDADVRTRAFSALRRALSREGEAAR